MAFMHVCFVSGRSISTESPDPGFAAGPASRSVPLWSLGGRFDVPECRFPVSEALLLALTDR